MRPKWSAHRNVRVIPTPQAQRLARSLSVGAVRYSSMWHCIAHVYRTEGLLRFYRGLGTYLLRVVPNATIQFFAYETLKDLATGQGGW